MSGDDWVKFVRDLGFPIAVALGLAYAIYRILVWLGENVVKPVTARHLAFMDRHTKFMDDLSAGVTTMSQAQQVLAHQGVDVTERLDRVLALHERMLQGQQKRDDRDDRREAVQERKSE